MANKGFTVNLQADKDSSSKGIGFSKRPINYDRNFATPVLPESKAPRYIGLSAALHMAVLGAVLFLGPMFEPQRVETITVELTGFSEPLGTEGSGPAGEIESSIASEPVAPIKPSLPTEATSDDVIVAKLPEKIVTAAPTPPPPTPKPTPVVRATPPKPVPAPVQAPPPAPAPKVAVEKPVEKPAAQPVQQPKAQAAPRISTVAESDVAVPANLDDVAKPELEETQFNEKAVAEFNEAELNSDFEKVDQKNSKGVQAIAKDLEDDSESSAQEQEKALAEVDAQTRQDSAAIAAHTEALRQKNAQAIAAAQAQEKADKEARAAAAAQAAAASALAAKKAAEAQAARGNGGSGGTGANTGTPEGVRSLEQLRQMPGNPRPSYSAAERVARNEGETVFLAYITKAGTPTDFRKMKSTGYENLDSKTLAALKRWKFYPGQEGWVEIPFRWEIRGETQETSALNRAVNQNPQAQIPEKSEE